MKLMKKQSEERATAFRAHGGGSEQRFRYPAHEEISETDCCDHHRWNESDQPADADRPVRALAS
jgi:hypothetical protein